MQNEYTKQNNKTIVIHIAYGGEELNIAKVKDTHNLQTEINIMLRWLVNAPWYIVNKRIRTELQINTLEDIIPKKREKLIVNVEVHEIRLIRNVMLQPGQRKENKQS